MTPEPDQEAAVDGSAPETAHVKHCFVVMPFGKSTRSRRWFKGWYEVVIQPAVRRAGYEPVLSAAEEQPGAINDEIRAHLAFDPMVVVDLGGYEPEDSPNPNVMYELGIRHAFGLPLVMMAREGQELPFDISNQRVIVEQREILSQETNRERLVAFIKAAEEGRFYKPMDAVGRQASIETALVAIGGDSLLGALTREIQDLRHTVTNARHGGKRAKRSKRSDVRSMLFKAKRQPLFAAFSEAGGTTKQWARILQRPLSDDERELMSDWTMDEWLHYLAVAAVNFGLITDGERLGIPKSRKTPSPTPEVSDDEFADFETLLSAVKAEMPKQPWPTGASKDVALRLGVTGALVQSAISELINRGEFMSQIGGRLCVPESSTVVEDHLDDDASRLLGDESKPDLAGDA